MALIKPDFTEVPEQIGPGTYKGQVRTAAIKEWPSGDSYIEWVLETVQESNPKNNGRRIFHRTSTSGKGAFQLQKFYKAATGQALTGQFDTDQLIGKIVELTIEDGMDKKTGVPTGYTNVKDVRATASMN